MGDINWSTVIKWLLTILVAGFIAQFGRMAAEYITGKLKECRKARTDKESAVPEEIGHLKSVQPSPGIEAPDQEIPDKKLIKQFQKIEKKKAKAAKKG